MAGFCLLISPLGAIDQARLQRNLQHAWYLEKTDEHSKAIEFCNFLVDNVDIPDEEKIHYLISLTVFHSGNGEYEEYLKDIVRIKMICSSSKEANYQMREYH